MPCLPRPHAQIVMGTLDEWLCLLDGHVRCSCRLLFGRHFSAVRLTRLSDSKHQEDLALSVQAINMLHNFPALPHCRYSSCPRLS